MKTHGLTHHPLYSIWKSMRYRCSNIKHKDYINYGARGIKVCNGWNNKFILFYEWSINKWGKGLLLDRIDNNGNYEPSNCRFTTNRISSLNRRMQKNNKSGHIGVYKYGKNERWLTQIKINGKNVYIGTFESIEQAVMARNDYITDNKI